MYLAVFGYTAALAAMTFGTFSVVMKREDYQLSRTETLKLARFCAVIAAFSLPMLSNDIFSVLAYGETMLRGFNTFVDGSALAGSLFASYLAPEWREAPFVYGPLNMFLAVAAVFTGKSMVGALVVFKLITLFFILVCIEVAHRIIPENSDTYDTFSLIALSPLFIIQGAGQAHTDSIAGACIAGMLLCLYRSRTLGAGFFLGLAVAAKYTAALAAPVLVLLLWLNSPALSQKLKNIAAATAVSLAIFALTFIPFWEGTKTLTVPADFLASKKPSKSIVEVVTDIAVIGKRLIGGEAAVNTADTVSSYASLDAERKVIWPVVTRILQVLSLLLMLRLFRRFPKTAEEVISSFAIVTVIVTCFASPVFQPWYFLAYLPLFAFLHKREWVIWSAVGFGLFNFMNVMHLIPRNHLLYMILPPVAVFSAILFFFVFFRARFLRD